LKQIAGWIGDDIFTCEGGKVTPVDRRDLAMLCLHDAAIIGDTVRANLFAPNRTEDDLWRALEAVELSDRIRQEGGLDAWIRQDRLSLGEAQRLNLARAFLTDRPMVLLDEPSEHLDDDQGRRIVVRLLNHLADRIVVTSTHRAMITSGAISPCPIIDLSR
jgi:ABC-type transport system involved in cytochrome bd biosynthesis fused ATPase/permease subunit